VSALWWGIPLGATLVLLIPMIILLLHAADEAARLGAAAARLGELRPALVALRDDAAAAHRRLRSITGA
jgi:hypothetical protein